MSDALIKEDEFSKHYQNEDGTGKSIFFCSEEKPGQGGIMLMAMSADPTINNTGKNFINVTTSSEYGPKVEIELQRLITEAFNTNTRFYNAVLKCYIDEMHASKKYTLCINGSEVHSFTKSNVTKTIGGVNRLILEVDLTEEFNSAVKSGAGTVVVSLPHADISLFGVGENAPSVTVDYLSEKAVFDDDVYSTFDVGKAGEGRVNLLNGKLEYSKPLYSDADLSVPISYNYNDYDGWKLSLQQKLIKYEDTFDALGGDISVYVDGEGKEHHFIKKYYYLDDKEEKVYIKYEDCFFDENGDLIYRVDGSADNVKDVVTERVTKEDMKLDIMPVIATRKPLNALEDEYYFYHTRKSDLDMGTIAGSEEFVFKKEEETGRYYVEMYKKIINYDKETIHLFTTRISGYKQEFYHPEEVDIDADGTTGKVKEKYAFIIEGETEAEKVKLETPFVEKVKLYLDDNDKKSFSLIKSDYKFKYWLSSKINLTYIKEDYQVRHRYIYKTAENGDEEFSQVVAEEYFGEEVDEIRQYVDELENQKIDYTYAISHVNAALGEIEDGSSANWRKLQTSLQKKLNGLNKNLSDYEADTKSVLEDKYVTYRNSNLVKLPSKEGKSDEKYQKELKKYYEDAKNTNHIVYLDYDNLRLSYERQVSAKQSEISTLQIISNDVQMQLQEAQIEEQKDSLLLKKQELTAKIDALDVLCKQYANRLKKLIFEAKQKARDFITMPDGTVYGFDYYGNLVEISHADETATLIHYDYGTYRNDKKKPEKIIKVTDRQGRNTVFEYSGDKNSGTLLSMTDKKGRKTLFSHGGTRLQGITMPDNSGTSLRHDADGALLMGVEDSTGKCIEMTRREGKIYSVASYTKIASISDDEIVRGQRTELGRLTFTIKDFSCAEIYDGKNKKYFTFDLKGRLISETDTVSDNITAYEYQSESKKISATVYPNAANMLKKTSWSANDSEVIYQKNSHYVDADGTYIYEGQTAYVYGTLKSRNLIVSGWATAANAKSEVYFGARFLLQATATYTDGTYDNASHSFDWRNKERQFIAFPLIINEKKILEKISVQTFFSGGQGAEVVFEDVSLKAGSFSISKKSNDKLRETITDNNGVLVITYDKKEKPLKAVYTRNDGQKFTSEYYYDSEERLVMSVEMDGLVAENIYDKDGKLIKTLEYHRDEPCAVITETFEETEENAESNNDTFSAGYGYLSGYPMQYAKPADGKRNANTFSYNAGLLTGVRHNGMSVGYTYDGFGREKEVSIAGKPYLTKTYEKENGADKQTLTYATGEVFESVYDKKDRIKTVTYNGAAVLDYQHNGTDCAVYKETSTSGEETECKTLYTEKGEVMRQEKGGDYTAFEYDRYGNVKSQKLHCNALQNDIVCDFAYDNSYSQKAVSATINGTITEKRESDGLGRPINESIACGTDTVLSRQLFYGEEGDSASYLVTALSYGTKGVVSDDLTYTYTKDKNISEVRKNGLLCASYRYDALGRLKRENNFDLSSTTVYHYDENGNILCKYVYPLTTEDEVKGEPDRVVRYGYAYKTEGWRDQLVSYDGKACRYDALGNPTLYKDKAMTWTRGRMLSGVGGNTVYVYDAQGNRISKTVDGVTKKYFLSGGKIIAEYKEGEEGTQLVYRYGLKDVTGFSYGGKEYFYRKNLQGDITNIFDAEGNNVVEYLYDAWGTHSVIALGGTEEEKAANLMIGHLNPFRYRGYYFDEETDFYALPQRYYDPKVGRFINADSIDNAMLQMDQINGLNLYAFCLNNPVNYSDPTGGFVLTLLAILGTLAVGTAVGGLAGGISAVATGQNFWAGFAGGAVSGLISTIGMGLAVVTGGFGGLAIAGISGFVAGFGGSIVQQGIEVGWGNLSKENFISAAISGGISAAINMITFGVTNFAMRETVGLFENIFDKSIKFSTRLASSMSISGPALIVTGMFSGPTTLGNTLIDIIRYYGQGNSYGKYYRKS